MLMLLWGQLGWAGAVENQAVNAGLQYVLPSEAIPEDTSSGQAEQNSNQTAKPLSEAEIEGLRQTCRGNNSVPALVVIKPDRFTMGSGDVDTERDSDEQPPHQVTIPRPFAIGRCEVTVGQFRRFVDDTKYKTTAETNGKGCYVWQVDKGAWEQVVGHYWDKPGFAQTEQHPVTCISWDDAQRYLHWLSQRTGARYRLPSEAEWEYVARAGTLAPRPDPPQDQCRYANGADQDAKSIAGKDWILAECRDGHGYTAPVASYRPNDFGVFDSLGNVWEWTQDCWHGNYDNAPRDGAAWQDANAGDCQSRVVRGGSWFSDPRGLRSADRDRGTVDDASGLLGFRVARDM